MNTKNIFKWAAGALCLATAVLTTSCSSDFLDREPEGYYATDKQVSEAAKWNANVMLGQMNSVTSRLVSWKSGGTSQQHDFGQKSIDIATDLMSGDMVFSRGCNYGWFRNDARLLNATANAERSSVIWTTYYKIIYASNSCIEAVGGVEPEGDEQKLYFAAAKVARAWAYFNLVVNYARNYETSKNQKILPVYDQIVDAAGEPQTVDSVYNFILKDLDEAYTAYVNAANDGYEFSGIDLPNYDVCQTLKAYVLMQRGAAGDYAAALQAADLALQITDKSILPQSELFYGFNTINNNNWMWGIDINENNTGGLCTFWGMMDYFTYSYAAAGDVKSINSDLFSQIPATDARKRWFGFYSGANFVQVPSLLLPINKFFDNGRSPMGDRNWRNDIHFMRVEEAYLLAAEAAARLGDAPTAVSYLEPLVAERDADKAAALATMSASELLDEIYFEWRVELWGEGRSLITAKRFKKDLQRSANDYYGATIGNQGATNYNDKAYYFSIPTYELENNPLMKEATIIQ